MARLDATNLEILRRLQSDGRLSMADLSSAIGRAESSTRERVAMLTNSGLLRGYGAKVDWAAAGLACHAVIRARCPAERVPEVANQLRGLPFVTQAFFMTGRLPIVVVLQVHNLVHLQDVLRQAIATGHLLDVEAEVALESLVVDRHP